MPEQIAPDTKDWTWVLEQPCPDCGFDPAAQALADLPRLIHDSAMVWTDVLRRPDARERPAPGRVVAAGVRLPRPRRAPPLRPSASG